MSSDWERGYGAGFSAGMKAQRQQLQEGDTSLIEDFMRGKSIESPLFPRKSSGDEFERHKRKRKGKLSAYNKFVKANASKPRFRYKSG